MLTAVIFAAAIILGPVILVLGALALLGAAVAAMADGVSGGLVRPNPS
ncbi:MAG TPA: hypothetical protein VID95_11035 [Candidatus Limnocylindrales bacterium]